MSNVFLTLQKIAGGQVTVTNATTAPDRVMQGIPLEANGNIAADTSGAIVTHSQGLPITAEGRIASSIGAGVTTFSGLEFTAAGRVVLPPPLPFTGAAFLVTITGLTDGEARIGDQASIGYTIFPDNGTETVAWGVSPGDDTYGTGANPTDYTAGDEGLLWVTVTDDGDSESTSAPIRYAPGTAPVIADGEAWTVDDTAVSIDGSASGANLTFTYAISGQPAGITVNSSSGLITGTPTAVASGTITVTATDQYGRTLQDTFTFTSTLRAQATAAGALGPYSFTINVAITPVATSSDFTLNGNTLTYTISPALPTGLSLASNGTLSGTPTTLSASSSYTVTGQDEYGRDTDSTFDLAVVADMGFGDDFVMVAETTGASETFTIPCVNNGTFSATIDWGDSSTSTITAYNDSDLTHTYASAGDHTIKISGSFGNISFNNGGDRLKVKKILNWGDVGFVRLDNAFQGCANLTEASSNGNTNTTGVSTLFEAFLNCTSLATLDVSNWDVSSVSSMFNAFRGVPATTIDTSGWDTSSLTNVVTAFFGCSNLTSIEISGWDITGLANATNFLNGANNALSTAEYDAVLVAWEAQAYQNNVPIHFGDATYTSGSAAATARAQLVTDGWTITDGGSV